MKRFMFLSIGLLGLALALLIGFEIGSQRAEAQSSPEVAGFSTFSEGSYNYCFVLLSNGDVYCKPFEGETVGNCLSWLFRTDEYACLNAVGNFWGGPTATSKSTWGGVKEQFKK